MEKLAISHTIIDNLFVDESEMPEHSKIATINQREYLLNGEMVAWNGDVASVFSPVFVPGPNGLTRKLLGVIPQTTAKEALEALEAAVTAYDNGQGVWPTMSVDERIK